jgi:hypothetical protein
MEPLLYNSIVRPESFKTDHKSLAESIANCVLKSGLVKDSVAKHVTSVKKFTTPPGELDIMKTEQQEYLKLAQPTTLTEHFLTFFGRSSQRQAPLLAHASKLRADIRDAEILNEEIRLIAAITVEYLHQQLFAFNSDLQDALCLFTTTVALANTDPLKVGGKADWEATWLVDGAKAFFALSDIPLDEHGERFKGMEHNLRQGQKILINSDPGAWHETSFRQLGKILVASGEARCLNGAAIVSRDETISLSCNLDVEKIQQAARDVIAPPTISRSDEDEPIGYEERRAQTRAIMRSFIELAEEAIAQIEKTDNEIRRCIMKTLFPNTQGLTLLRELYPQRRAEELIREHKNRKR